LLAITQGKTYNVATMDFRSFIEAAGQRGELITINRPVSTDFELANVAHALDGRLVLFNQIEGHPGWRVCSGACSARAHFSLSLGVPADELVHHLARSLESRRRPPVIAQGACQEVVEPDVDLDRLPILLHLPGDGGHYVASNVVIVEDPELGGNMSYHRLLRLDRRRFAARIVERRGTDSALARAGGDLPVAICIGVSLATHLAASMSPAPGTDELAIAHALSPTPLVRCLSNDLCVPAEAEIVLEGRITGGLASEGPFMDLTETMDFVRQQPIIEIDLITHRRDPIYHALLPGGLEHKLLMGMPKEPTILAEVNKVACCTAVHITPGGASWLHAVVQIEKRGPADGRLAIEAAFRGHGSLKHVWVVDGDVDPADPRAVEWAMATRFQADRDLIILEDQPGSSLDPSGSHAAGQKSRTSKMGLDCTIPWGADRAAYARGEYGAVELSEYLPSAFAIQPS
jgi:UbiD family decarboxylase